MLRDRGSRILPFRDRGKMLGEGERAGCMQVAGGLVMKVWTLHVLGVLCGRRVRGD